MSARKNPLTSSEWSKEAISSLIEEYAKHKHLYDPKSSLYHNKQARAKSLEKVVAKVLVHRPDTTDHDVYRKFQTLRTQYGQEWQKIRKTQSIDEEFVYIPKVWWWDSLSFLKPFMKSRGAPQAANTNKNDFSDEESFQEITLEIPQENSVTRKKIRLENNEYTIVNKSATEDSKDKYVIYEEPGNDSQQAQLYVEPYAPAPQPAPPPAPEAMKRHEEIGKFVAAQMAMIKDDKLFYQTQIDILTLINKAQITQLERNSKRKFQYSEVADDDL